MFWPIVLPMQITFGLMLALGVVTLYLGKRRKWQPHTLGILLSLPILLCVPCCRATMNIVDHFRFGMFYYDDFQAIRDFRIERYMPPTAKQISVYKHFGGNGYRAKFTISPEDLQSWHSEYWNQHEKYSVMDRPDNDGAAAASPDEFHRLFVEFNWSMPKDCVRYRGPIAGNGAGYRIDYSPSENTAFLSGCYW